jgi:hypothetical protein
MGEVLVRLWNGKGGWALRRVWIELVPHPTYGQWFQVRARAGAYRDDWTMRTNSVAVAIGKAREIVEDDDQGTWRELTI